MKDCIIYTEYMRKCQTRVAIYEVPSIFWRRKYVYMMQFGTIVNMTSDLRNESLI